MSLAILWLVSIVLSGLALLIMSGLITARLVAEHRARALASQRSKLVPLLLGDASDEEVLAAEVGGSSMLADLTIELIELVRGEERDRLIATATRLGVAAKLREQLEWGSPRTRSMAAETLGRFLDALSTNALEHALDDRSADVRMAAALALSASDRAPDAELLVRHLGLGTRETSMLTVALFQDIARTRPSEISGLIEASGSPPSVRAAAIDALSASGDYSLVPVIVELAMAADPAGEELARYLRALGAFQHPGAAPAILQWLDAPTWWVRSAAAEAAGRVGLPQAMDKLTDLLEDPDWWVRFRAGEALLRFGKKGEGRLLQVGLVGSSRARSAAALTLAEHGTGVR